jgi:hypothetical protein
MLYHCLLHITGLQVLDVAIGKSENSQNGEAGTSSLAHANAATKNGFESFIKALKEVK